MIISSALFILASYVGPTPSPDRNLTPMRRQQQRIERNNPEYNPRTGNNHKGQKNKMSEPERAEEGRMVVPEKFR
jgi:hypothetical protein